MSNTDNLVEKWDNDAVVIRDGELPHHILETLASILDDLDTDIQDVYDTRFINTATDGHLEKIGEQVGVTRLNQQSDEALRIRVESGYARAVSDSTFDTFSRVVLNVFDAESQEITLEGDDGEPVVIVHVPLSRIEESPLTDSQIAEELTESVPASDGVRVKGTGTFRLGGGDYTVDSDQTLSNGTLGGYTIES